VEEEVQGDHQVVQVHLTTHRRQVEMRKIPTR
jgi:hypothetical protein